MSININEVSFKVNKNRWLEIWVGDQEIVSVDTEDGGLSVDPDAAEIGNIIENDDGYFEFLPAGVEEPEPEQAPEQEGGFRVVYTPPVLERILATLECIEQKL